MFVERRLLALAFALFGCDRAALGEPDVLAPDLAVEPSAVSFGQPGFGELVERTVYLANRGDADLSIRSLTVVEADPTHEITADPVGEVALVIRPGRRVPVRLTLTNIDDEADVGELVVSSDDPDEAVLSVPLASELLGELSVATCVTTTAALVEDCVRDPEIIDLGDLNYDASVTREVTVYNAGAGNRALRVTDISVSNTTGNRDLFALAYFRYVLDPTNLAVVEEEVTHFPAQPLWLEADDGVDPPEALRVRITFVAGLDGAPVPPEDLVVMSDDPLNREHHIPFAGAIGCPPDTWNFDGQPGCEYPCQVTHAGLEECDGLDNDCNGQIDDGAQPGLCLICDASGAPVVAADDAICGAIDCTGWHRKAGTAGPTTIETCYVHTTIVSNRCEGALNCRDPNSDDCAGQALASEPQVSCGTCLYVDGCVGTTPGVCAPYAAGTPTALCEECDGGGGERAAADDSRCGNIDCSGWYALLGSAGPTTTETCHPRANLMALRCEGAGDCKDANTADCASQPPLAQAITTCGVCQRMLGCVGDVAGSCEDYALGTGAGLCGVCDGAGNQVAAADDAACGVIDCGGWYAKVGLPSPTETETCYAHASISTSRCEGLGDCRDANSADCDGEPLGLSPQETCGTCRYMSGCSGATPGSCSNYPPGTPTAGSCGAGVCERLWACDGTGAELCVPGLPTGADTDCDGVDENCDGQADESYVPYGCGVGECRASSTCAGGVASCTPLPPDPIDDPDDLLLDSNCDGIDGDAAIAYFVAVDGDDANPGTRPAPFATIQRGIQAAVSGQHVYVSQGSYNESVALKNGVSVYGGYSRANGWARSLSYVVTIFATTLSSGRMLGASGVNLTESSTVSDLEIVTADAPAGVSNYGLYCSNCPGLTLRGLRVLAGAGGPGADGVAGVVGASGNNGGNGAGGTCDNARGLGGAGGTNPACPRAGGGGGAGGAEGCNNGTAGGAGAIGTPGGAGGSYAQRDLCLSGCCGDGSGNAGGTGGSGAAGADGGSGAGGSGGAVAGGYWVTTGGQDGANGAHGNGGGGGGGGGSQCGSCVDDGGGNGGGGGGAGGCGGTRGTAGTGGAGSFGLFLVNSTGIVVQASSITSGAGGSGGSGAGGGLGGGRGSRGLGATTCTGEIGAGGNGGLGGVGGDGGAGGGGAGGPSYAVYRSGTAVNLAGNILTPGSGGAGGGSPVNAGAAGAAAQTN